MGLPDSLSSRSPGNLGLAAPAARSTVVSDAGAVSTGNPAQHQPCERLRAGHRLDPAGAEIYIGIRSILHVRYRYLDTMPVWGRSALWFAPSG